MAGMLKKQHVEVYDEKVGGYDYGDFAIYDECM